MHIPILCTIFPSWYRSWRAKCKEVLSFLTSHCKQVLASCRIQAYATRKEPQEVTCLADAGRCSYYTDMVHMHYSWEWKSCLPCWSIEYDIDVAKQVFECEAFVFPVHSWEERHVLFHSRLALREMRHIYLLLSGTAHSTVYMCTYSWRAFSILGRKSWHLLVPPHLITSALSHPMHMATYCFHSLPISGCKS